ncbi:hypothetical protein F8237_28560 [Bradyrhizobium betae]|uniref:Uncharacterized protein n=1 Tax=Bradyrhizobium betae TaxID=244734 RepID=A0A5P6PCD1_9BRAD|nr:hypothetical protein F8237_28560 [Bradyrhizobium betae]
MRSLVIALSCPGLSAASLRRCAAEPGPMAAACSSRDGSRLCGAALHAAPRPGHEASAPRLPLRRRRRSRH